MENGLMSESAKERAKIRKACPKCGKEMSILGLGTHERFCGAKKRPKEECPECHKRVLWLDKHMIRHREPIEDKPRAKYNAKIWTITMVNGNRQVAGTIPEYVAQKILRLMI